MSMHGDIAAQLEGIKKLKEGEKFALGMFAAVREGGQIKFISNWEANTPAPSGSEGEN